MEKSFIISGPDHITHALIYNNTLLHILSKVIMIIIITIILLLIIIIIIN